MEALREQMRKYYGTVRYGRLETNKDYLERKNRIWDAMDRYLHQHPDCDPCLLKAQFHEVVAEQFEPVIFPASPFYFEMGIRPGENWGVLWGCVAEWMCSRRIHLCHDTPAFKNIQEFGRNGPKVRLWTINDGFDYDHHCPNYTKLLKVGVWGILKEIEDRRREANPEELKFLDAAKRSNFALLRVAERFSERAGQLLETETEPKSREFLTLIARTARRIPAEPPKTFYEGLAMLLFLREAVASMEGVGVSVMGHLDRLLIDLYRRDLAEGRITEETAGDLLARWMVHTDIRFHIEDNSWPETSTCIELGGCDETGQVVFNDLTRLIIETHRAHKFLNPKLNCRYNAKSPAEYLDLMSSAVLAGHNNFAFLNDDILIPACVRAGKTLPEARLYVNGGCQETIVEGVEHSAGAYYYFNLVRVLDLCLQPLDAEVSEAVEPAVPPVIEPTGDFETWYRRFMQIMKQTIVQGGSWLRESARDWPQVLPCPLFSSFLTGCIETAKDYTRGGGKYNPAGIALVGLGTLVDSLATIRRAVFEEKWVTLPQLQAALRNNWTGAEALRKRIVDLPRYGQSDPEVNDLAARVAHDLAEISRSMTNERGGNFQPSMFVYYAFMWMGADCRATPDGRKNSDMLSQGCAPSRVRPVDNIPDIIHTLSKIDFAEYPGNAVLDVQLPVGGKIRPDILSALLRTFAQMGGMTLQINCVSVKELQDAKLHPQLHQDLTVRISGLSARFVALEPGVQDEIIGRTHVKL